MKIPILDLKKQYKSIENEVKEALSRILESQSFILGKEVEFLEKAISAYCKTRYGIGLNSGTDALILALSALGVGSGDEVITTPFSFMATAEAIVLLGAKPVFVDIDPGTYNINPALIEKKITKNTKAILPVHLYGLCADMDPILKIAQNRKIAVLEDCAQSIGSEYKGKRAGSMGSLGAISFYPGKNLGCYGDGGMIVTSDKEFYEKLKMLRNHGTSGPYMHKLVGYNSRLDEIQAAVLNVKFKYLEKWLNERIRIAGTYNEGLKGTSFVTPYAPDGVRHTFHIYALRSKKRDDVVNHLVKNGIEARVYYPLPLHLQECFRFLGYKRGDLPESEKAASEIFAVPIYPELKKEEIGFILDALKRRG